MTILVLDDDADIGMAARLLLQRRCAPVQALQQPAQLLPALRQQGPRVLLLDMNFLPGRSDGAQGLQLLQQVLALPEPPQVIVMTAYAEVELAVQALKLGAFDFITKPWDNARLIATVQAALALRPEGDDALAQQLPGSSSAMLALRRMVAALAGNAEPVLIVGAPGSGRSAVAEALHGTAAPTALRRFSWPGEGLEAWRAALSQPGTLLLEDPLSLPLAQQQQALAMLESAEAQAGAALPRLISLSALDDAQRYDPARVLPAWQQRLGRVVLRMPSLAQRVADLPQLAVQRLARAAARLRRPPKSCSEAALQALQAQAWPGQLRQLDEACERAVLSAAGPRYEPADFGLAEAAPASSGEPDTRSLQERERAALAEAMDLAQGNISEAARRLGLSRAALYRRLEKHGF